MSSVLVNLSRQFAVCYSSYIYSMYSSPVWRYYVIGDESLCIARQSPRFCFAISLYIHLHLEVGLTNLCAYAQIINHSRGCNARASQ